MVVHAWACPRYALPSGGLRNGFPLLLLFLCMGILFPAQWRRKYRKAGVLRAAFSARYTRPALVALASCGLPTTLTPCGQPQRRAGPIVLRTPAQSLRNTLHQQRFVAHPGHAACVMVQSLSLRTLTAFDCVITSIRSGLLTRTRPVALTEC